MKKHSYGKLIKTSWHWMLEVLFRPFNLKKWIMLGIIIVLAGQIGGGVNLNVSGDRGNLEKVMNFFGKEAPSIQGLTLPQDVTSQLGIAPQAQTPRPDIKTLIPVIAVGIIIILFIGIFVLLWIWVGSNFSFVFIDSIIRNDASLRVPFHRNKTQGNSYFKWNIVFALISLLIFGVIITLPIMQLVRSGVFSAQPVDVGRILSIVLPYVPVLLGAGLLFFLAAFFTLNFVLPIMYKKKLSILKAWGVFLGLLRKNIGEILKYILIKIVLSILAGIAAILIAIIGVIILLLIGGLAGLLGWLIYSITPAAAKIVVIVILTIVSIPLFVFLGFLFNALFIPIPVFFRTFSIHVLGSIDESLDLFAPRTSEEIAADADDSKHKRSMRLVWFTVVFPVLLALTGLLLAIAIPNFMQARQKALQMRQPGFLRMMPSQEAPALPRRKGTGKIVTVYLTNGNSFEAEIETESGQNIAFRIEGGTFVLPRSDILRIEE